MTTTHRLDLPRYDQAVELHRGRDGRMKRVRPVWEPLQGNSRAYWRTRHAATVKLIDDIILLGKAAKIPAGRHLTVTLTWAPGDKRIRDADNLWPFMKTCCDALARGPRKDLAGLRLVPDDTPQYMTKYAPVIEPPPADGLWLTIEVTE